MDSRLPGLVGIEATRRIAAGGAGTHVLVLTPVDRDEYVYRSLEAGRADFLLNHVLSKRSLRDRVQAVIYAYESGLVRASSAAVFRLLGRWVRAGRRSSRNLPRGCRRCDPFTRPCSGV